MTRKIETVLVDLDGTLIDIDWRQNIRKYYRRLKKMLPEMGSKTWYFYHIKRAVDLMMKDNTDGILNIDKYFKYLNERSSLPAQKNRELYFKFYEDYFHEFRGSIKNLPGSHELLKVCKSRGMKLVLATNPVFPESAVKERLSWGEIDPGIFDLITHIQNSYHCKPNKKYFLETLAAVNSEPSKSLMVGDDYKWDIFPSKELGMYSWWAMNRKTAIRRGALSGRLTHLVELIQNGSIEQIIGSQNLNK